MDYARNTRKSSSGNAKIDNLIRSRISNGEFSFPKKNCARSPSSARSIVSPSIGARPCGEWKKQRMTICSQTTRVILCEAKDLAHAGLITTTTAKVPCPFVRSLAPLGMTEQQDRHLHLR